MRICFVCLGNICRSPTAEGVFRHLVAKAKLQHAIEIDSAGTAAYHAGERPDARSAEAARARDIELVGAARCFEVHDFERFDYVVAMDRSNRADLIALAPDASAAAKVALLRDFVEDGPRDADVPDPYYGGPDGFDRVLDICEQGCVALLEHLREHHDLRSEPQR
jgi:protein-tyrosine phosphatase